MNVAFVKFINQDMKENNEIRKNQDENERERRTHQNKYL